MNLSIYSFKNERFFLLFAFLMIATLGCEEESQQKIAQLGINICPETGVKETVRILNLEKNLDASFEAIENEAEISGFRIYEDNYGGSRLRCIKNIQDGSEIIFINAGFNKNNSYTRTLILIKDQNGNITDIELQKGRVK